MRRGGIGRLIGVVALVAVLFLGAGGRISTTRAATPRSGTSSAAPVRIGWPCAGCMVELPSSYRPHHPTGLLVVLHGDEGAPGEIAGVFGPIASAHNLIMFAPKCPTALGCRLANGSAGSTNSWWGWFHDRHRYSDGWLGAQLKKVEGAYDIDHSREYILGWSGGADYLGWYALQDGARFAAAAFIAGGVPYHPGCGSTRLAAFFLLGSADPRYQSGQPTQVKSLLTRCGEATKAVVIPGADHEGTMLDLSSRGYAAMIVKWLLQHLRAT